MSEHEGTYVCWISAVEVDPLDEAFKEIHLIQLNKASILPLLMETLGHVLRPDFWIRPGRFEQMRQE